MDIETCIKKLGYIGVLDFATVDEEGAPQVRNISAIHYEGTTLYFLTARGKSFARQLKKDGRVQILGYTKYKETIRLSGKAVEVPDEEQIKWRNVLYAEQPYLENVHAEGLYHRIFLSLHPPHHAGVFCGGQCRDQEKGLLHQRGLHRLRYLPGSMSSRLH